jgi:hypothetical protein
VKQDAERWTVAKENVCRISLSKSIKWFDRFGFDTLGHSYGFPEPLNLFAYPFSLWHNLLLSLITVTDSVTYRRRGGSRRSRLAGLPSRRRRRRRGGGGRKPQLRYLCLSKFEGQVDHLHSAHDSNVGRLREL